MMIGSRPPASQARDHAQRRRALDPTESFIVQAPAGSGKTGLLIQRYLTLLATVDQPESIMAITFTRKAAGEMRHRVIDALTAAEVGGQATTGTPHERRTRELARRVLDRDIQLDWELLDHPSRLRIQTIDSLCGSLVRQMPWMSRMGSPPRPEDHPTRFYRRAARATLDMLDSEPVRRGPADALERLLTHLDNNLSGVESLVASMLERRDQWLRHVVGNRPTRAFRRELETALQQIVVDELKSLRERFPQDAVDETLRYARFAACNLGEQGGASPLASCLELDALPGSDVESLGPWLGLADLLLTKKGERRRQLTRSEGFPATGESRAAKRECLAMSFDREFLSLLHRIRSLPPVSLGGPRWAIIDALMTLLPLAVAQLRLGFQLEGTVDFTEIAHASQRALGDNDGPTDLAFALDCRIRHLLVDEFQDTSQSQFDLLRSLTADWGPGDGRTLFLVGDPMQSIYGFRQAEVGLFLRARRFGVGNVGLTPVRLSVNFRSESGIVEWVNRALGAAFPSVEDTFTGAVTYEPSVAFKDAPVTPDAVRVHPFPEDDADAEAARVLEIIAGARASRPGSSIAVLVRSRSHLFRIAAALRATRQEFRAVEIDPLGARPVVQDLLALTRALLHPADRIAWLAALRAPWCGLTLADLHALAADDWDSALWDLMNDADRRSRMSDDGQRRVGRFVDIVADVLERRATMGIRRWIESAWIDLGGPACLDGRTDMEDARAYLDLLEESVRGSDLRDQAKFSGDVERLFARPSVDAGEDLQLLTIHKAKGLEFDTVILPGLGRLTQHESPRLLNWLEYIDREGRPRLIVAPIREAGDTGETDDALYAYLRRVQAAKSDNESTRLLYVAVTRARCSVHLLGHVNSGDGAEPKAPGPGTLLSKIWGEVEGDYRAALLARPRAADPARAEAVGSAPVLRRLSADWVAPPLPDEVRWNRRATGPASADLITSVHPRFEWASQMQRRVGIVVHAILQRARLPTANADGRGWNHETIRSALYSEGLDGHRLVEAIARVERALNGTFRDPRGRWILTEHGEAGEDRREYPLAAPIDGRVRRVVIDRTFVEHGVRWIIDYKTGIHHGTGAEAFLDNEEARYRAQMETYALVMSRIDSRPIRLGLYFPLLCGWREWSFHTWRAHPSPATVA